MGTGFNDIVFAIERFNNIIFAGGRFTAWRRRLSRIKSHCAMERHVLATAQRGPEQ